MSLFSWIDLPTILKIIIVVGLVIFLFYARQTYINSDSGRNALPVDTFYYEILTDTSNLDENIPSACYQLQAGDVDDQTLVGRWVKAAEFLGDNFPCLVPVDSFYYPTDSEGKPDETKIPYPCEGGVATRLPYCKSDSLNTLGEFTTNENGTDTRLPCRLVSGYTKFGDVSPSEVDRIGDYYNQDKNINPEKNSSNYTGEVLECSCPISNDITGESVIQDYENNYRDASLCKTEDLFGDWDGKCFGCCLGPNAFRPSEDNISATGSPLIIAGCIQDTGASCIAPSASGGTTNLWLCRVRDSPGSETEDDVNWEGRGGNGPLYGSSVGNRVCKFESTSINDYSQSRPWSHKIGKIQQCDASYLRYDRTKRKKN